VELFAVDVSEANLAAFAERFAVPAENCFTSVEALYERQIPDVVSVCTWPGLHAPMVTQAAALGVKGIICEKPMALDAGEIRAMLAACEASGTRLAIAHQRRYEALFQLARKLLVEGAIGAPLQLEARVGGGWDILSWTVHWFDMAAFLLRSPAVRVLAGVDFRGERRYGQAIESASTIFVEYADGSQANFVTGPDSPSGDGISLRGPDGLLQITRSEVLVWNRSGFATHQPANLEEGFAALIRDVIDGIDDPAHEILCDARNVATEIAYAAHESARSRRWVSLPMEVEFAPLEVLYRPAQPLASGDLRIVLMADEHFGSGGREGLTLALGALPGARVDVIEASEGLTGDTLKDAAMLVLYHTQETASPGTQAALEGWVAAGKPLLLVHCAVGAYRGWATYQSWCGRVWDWQHSKHPHEPSTLQTLPGDVMPWNQAWLPKDEVFIHLAETAPTRDCLEVTVSEGTFPAAWSSVDHPNVAVWVPGHRRDLWSVPAMKQGLHAMIRHLSSLTR
jgi:predicted dehydrogenase